MANVEPGSGPTVIVSRRVAVGHLDDFARWHEKLLATASTFPGLLGAEAQRPNEVHPQDWVTRFQFETVADLDRWINSPTRLELLSAGDRFIEGPTREHRVADHSPVAGIVTAVISKRLRDGAVVYYRAAQERIDEAMTTFPGFLGSSVSEPIPGIQDDHVTVLMFRSKESLDRWLESAERQELLSTLDTLVEGEHIVTVYGGFSGWFSQPTQTAPKRWKQAVAVLIPLYPTVVLLTLFQREFAPDAPLLPSLLVSNIVSVAALTWILMPWVTRVLSSWLVR